MAGTRAQNYSLLQKALHWSMALLILFNLLFPDRMTHLGDLFKQGQTITPQDIASANIHAYIGIAVLVLFVLRLVIRLVHGVPPSPAGEPAIAKLAARVVHWSFYALFLLMPLAGMGAYYGHIRALGWLHGGPLKYILWVLVIAHILAALVHQFYWKTNLLARMLRG